MIWKSNGTQKGLVEFRKAQSNIHGSGDDLMLAFRERANEEGIECSVLISQVLQQAISKPAPKNRTLR